MSLTLVILAAALLVWRLEPEGGIVETPEMPFSVIVTADGKREELECWKDEEENWFVFLPGYAKLNTAEIKIGENTMAEIGESILTDGMSCEVFEINVSYTLKWAGEQSSFTFLQSGGLPTMYIDVQSGSMDYIHAKKGNEESGTLRLYGTDGLLLNTLRIESINGRGNDTWYQSKKPYSLKLTTEEDLLGLGTAQKWILASNPNDASHIRNKLIYDYAEEAGLAYSPDSEWIDLYLHGEYAGLYLLCERNEIHSERVDLAEDNSFLVSVELETRLATQGYPFITTESGAALRIHHSAVNETELRAMWQAAENAILAEDGIDPETGKHWTELIDLDSWARKYLIEEIFGNLDAGAVSQYFYCDLENGKICAGPVWDYDMSMGNVRPWQLRSPRAYFADRPLLRTGMDQPWFYALCRDETFHGYVVKLYETEFRPLLERYLDDNLNDYVNQIGNDARLDQLRWNTEELLAEVESIRTYMTQRLEFLTDVWLENETYYTVLMKINEGSNTACYAVKPGELALEPPVCDYRNDVIGWCYTDTDEPYDPTKPIYEDTEIYLKLGSLDDGKVSPVQVVPIVVVFALMTAVMAVDKFRRKKKGIGKKEKENRKFRHEQKSSIIDE